MKNNNLASFLINIIFSTIIILIIAYLSMFSWNYGMLYLIPHMDKIGYMNALGIIVIVAMSHILLSYYISKAYIIRNKRSEISQSYYIINMLDTMSKKIDDLSDKSKDEK